MQTSLSLGRFLAVFIEPYKDDLVRPRDASKGRS